jgi:hypothetical protein
LRLTGSSGGNLWIRLVERCQYAFDELQAFARWQFGGQRNQFFGNMCHESSPCPVNSLPHPAAIFHFSGLAEDDQHVEKLRQAFLPLAFAAEVGGEVGERERPA